MANLLFTRYNINVIKQLSNYFWDVLIKKQVLALCLLPVENAFRARYGRSVLKLNIGGGRARPIDKNRDRHYMYDACSVSSILAGSCLEEGRPCFLHHFYRAL